MSMNSEDLYRLARQVVYFSSHMDDAGCCIMVD